MIDWSRVTGFQWDAGNARKSEDKHGVTQGEAEQVFFNAPLLVADGARHSAEEPRFHALGRTDGDQALHISFTLRDGGARLRFISARDMSRNERAIYAKQA